MACIHGPTRSPWSRMKHTEPPESITPIEKPCSAASAMTGPILRQNGMPMWHAPDTTTLTPMMMLSRKTQSNSGPDKTVSASPSR